MDEDLKLGTPETALRSCVSMLAALTSQREDQLIYWLDLYYQLRRFCEICKGIKTGPELIRKDDLLPMLDTAVREAMRGTAMKAAEAVTEKRKTRKPAARPEPVEEIRKPDPEPEPEAAPKPGPWTLYKRKIFARLQQAREAGYTIAQIAEASGGVLSDRKVISAINATQLRQEEWKALEKALNTVMLLQIPEGPDPEK